MALVETINLAHTPPSITIFAALYKDVENASFLREQLLAGNTDFEYAFIDASLILSTTHILAAAFRAINDLINNRLRSRNVHAETVFCLGPNNNISTSLTTFGINPKTTTSLLILKIIDTSSSPSEPSSTTTTTTTLDTTPAASATKTTLPSTSTSTSAASAASTTPLSRITTHLTTHIHGTPLPFTNSSIGPLTDLAKLRKAYKITDVTIAGGNAGGKAGSYGGKADNSMNGAGGKGKVGKAARRREKKQEEEEEHEQEQREGTNAGGGFGSVEGDVDGDGDADGVGEVDGVVNLDRGVAVAGAHTELRAASNGCSVFDEQKAYDERKELEAIILGMMALRGS